MRRELRGINCSLSFPPGLNYWDKKGKFCHPKWVFGEKALKRCLGDGSEEIFLRKFLLLSDSLTIPENPVQPFFRLCIHGLFLALFSFTP